MKYLLPDENNPKNLTFPIPKIGSVRRTVLVQSEERLRHSSFGHRIPKHSENVEKRGMLATRNGRARFRDVEQRCGQKLWPRMGTPRSPDTAFKPSKFIGLRAYMDAYPFHSHTIRRF